MSVVVSLLTSAMCLDRSRGRQQSCSPGPTGGGGQGAPGASPAAAGSLTAEYLRPNCQRQGRPKQAKKMLLVLPCHAIHRLMNILLLFQERLLKEHTRQQLCGAVSVAWIKNKQPSIEMKGLLKWKPCFLKPWNSMDLISWLISNTDLSK